MSAERHARSKQLFHNALERPRAERGEFLQQACGGDAVLLAEVLELLAVEDSSPDFLETPMPAPGPLPGAVPPLPERIGPFRLLRLLGEGGMGAVYEAEQERPHRRVALKVLHPGLSTPQMLRRFELESEVLGRLEHPGIARIYEAGTHDTGHGLQPWFAMELIEGRPLTEHCAALPLEQRLELLARVCDAVQHAHQRGIVHRDLKPANVLVDGSGQPKVLDFGIARATDGELQRATLRTDPGMIVGTLQYMSPEQATADPDAIDVRTDVYSLGVMLYELAAGRPPLDLAQVPMHEALRRVLELEPAPLRTSARVPVDVAVIAHKALAKDKDRRYAAAAELGADLRRFLRREPIAAQPPSRWYLLRRFAARNKGLTIGASLAAIALVSATIVSLVQVRVANAASERALRSARRAAIAAATVAAEHADFVTCQRQLESVAPGDRSWEWHHLASRADPTLARIDSPEPFLDVLLGPSGDELIALTGNGEVRRFGLPGLQLLGAQQLEQTPTGPAAFRRDGDALAAVIGPARDRVAVFDSRTGRRLAEVAADERLSLLACSPDGTQIAFAGRLAYLWQPSRGDAPRRLHGHDFKALAFSGDGRRLASGFGPPPDGAGYFLAYDAATGAAIGKSLHDSYLAAADLALDAAGTRLAVAYADKRIRLLDVDRNQLLPGLDGHTGAVRCVAFDPRGERLASAADDETVRLWQVGTRAENAVLGGLHGRPIGLAFSADGARVLARTAHGAALWSTGDGHGVLRGHPSYVYAVAFTGGGARIVSASYDGTIRIWDADSGDALWERKFAGEGTQALVAAAAAPLFASAHNSSVRVWDADSGEVVRTFDPGKNAGAVDVALSADGSLLAVRARAAVILWDTRSGNLVHRWRSASSTPYSAVAISPAGDRVAAECDRDAIRLWNGATGELVAELTGHTAPVEGLAFSADGTLLASGAVDRTVRLWDARTGAPRWSSTGHTDRVYALAFSPDGSRLASGSNDTTICLWDVASGEQVALLRGHADYVFALAFSPDGSRLVSGSGDRTLRVWDAEPLRKRWPAAEHLRQLRAQAEPALRALLAAVGATAAARQLRADPALEPLQREASIQALLRLTGGLPLTK